MLICCVYILKCKNKKKSQNNRHIINSKKLISVKFVGNDWVSVRKKVVEEGFQKDVLIFSNYLIMM